MLDMLSLTRPLGLALLLCSAVAGLGCRPPAARSFDRPEVRKHLALTTMIGREIYRRDMLTWSAGEFVRASFSPEQQQAIEGWVIDSDNPDTDVLLLSEVDGGEVDGELRVSFVIHCDGAESDSCRAETPPQPMPPSERNLAQFRAVTTAWSHPAFEQTAKAYNHAVIPTGEGTDARWWVYLIALDPDHDIVMLGQHYRFVIDADGRTVESFRPFSEGPAAIDLGATGMPEGARPISITVSHFLDELPTEMHVWAALYYNLDIVVATDVESNPKGMPMLWSVDSDGNIAPIE